MAVVPSTLAHECMDNFDSIVKGDDLGAIKASFSNSVSFKTPELSAWLKGNEYLENTTSIRISFGIYTEEAATQLHIPHLAGRLTAFVWPMVAAEEKPPFNLGTIDPL